MTREFDPIPVHFRIKHGRHKIIGQSAGAAEVNMVHTYSNCLGGYFYVLCRSLLRIYGSQSGNEQPELVGSLLQVRSHQWAKHHRNVYIDSGL